MIWSEVYVHPILNGWDLGRDYPMPNGCVSVKGLKLLNGWDLENGMMISTILNENYCIFLALCNIWL